MSVWIDMLALILAVGAVADAWRNGSLFAGVRATLENWSDMLAPDSWLQLPLELLLCSFCHTHWLAAGLLLWHYPLAAYWPALRGLTYALALARASWLLNGYLPEHLRYSRDGWRDPEARFSRPEPPITAILDSPAETEHGPTATEDNLSEIYAE